jgi:hypothetical protein
MNSLVKKSLMAALLGCSLAVFAGEPPPPPTKDALCHNIGGPQGLGANCDEFNASTGACLDLFNNPLVYAGIVIDPSDSAFNAHLAHGDGFALATFTPPLHLASEGLNHVAANVECIAIRAVTRQPPEPGN